MLPKRVSGGVPFGSGTARDGAPLAPAVAQQKKKPTTKSSQALRAAEANDIARVEQQQRAGASARKAEEQEANDDGQAALPSLDSALKQQLSLSARAAGSDGSSSSSSSVSSAPSNSSSMEARLKQVEDLFRARMERMEQELQQVREERQQAVEARDRAEAALRRDDAGNDDGLAEEYEDEEQHGDDSAPESEEGEDDSGEDTNSAQLPSRRQPGERAGQKAPGGPSPSQVESRARFATMAIPPPPRPATLEYSRIEVQLETWLKQFSFWFRATHIDEDADQIAQATASVDATIQRWWETRAESRRPASWNEFSNALRSTFIRTDEVERATTKLRDIRMTSNEDAHQYFLRVEDLKVRAGVADDNEFVLGTVFERFDHRRWPMASSKIAADIRTKQITTISALGASLTALALYEPDFGNRHQQKPSSQSSSSSSSNHRARLAATSHTEDTEQGEPDNVREQLESLKKQISALQAKGPGTTFGGRGARECRRCGDKSHWVSECKKPDNRTCFKCQKTGHISRDCHSGGGSDRDSKSTQSLNPEARQ